MTARFSRPVNILLVEDNDADVRMFTEALKDWGDAVVLHHVDDGAKAMSFLRNKAPFADKPRADLVFLDLNLPCMSGEEVLSEIKSEPGLHRIPVVVLTVSESEHDVQRSYDLHANSYVTKPSDPDRFFRVLDRTVDFWLRASHLPDA